MRGRWFILFALLIVFAGRPQDVCTAQNADKTTKTALTGKSDNEGKKKSRKSRKAEVKPIYDFTAGYSVFEGYKSDTIIPDSLKSVEQRSIDSLQRLLRSTHYSRTMIEREIAALNETLADTVAFAEWRKIKSDSVLQIELDKIVSPQYGDSLRVVPIHSADSLVVKPFTDSLVLTKGEPTDSLKSVERVLADSVSKADLDKIVPPQYGDSLRVVPFNTADSVVLKPFIDNLIPAKGEQIDSLKSVETELTDTLSQAETRNVDSLTAHLNNVAPKKVRGERPDSAQLELKIKQLSTQRDSLLTLLDSYRLQTDSLNKRVEERRVADSIRMADPLYEISKQSGFSLDTLKVDTVLLQRLEKEARAKADSLLLAGKEGGDSLSRRELKRLERYLARQDSTLYRHSPFFRDSIPISRLTLISAAVPGFAQFYEGKYWKIPVGYAAIGSTLYFGLNQNSKYKDFKRQYDDLKLHNATREELDPVHTQMIRHNTYRQLFFVGAAASYMALLADGVVNYPAETNRIKKATTLSMIIPGAGQFYNKSYWKIPFVAGGLASLFYVVDWNTRGYNRFELAYQQITDGDDSTVDEFNGRYDASYVKNLKDLYRRNRDLALICLVAGYVVNIADAHIDAQLQDFDVSSDLSYTFSPSVGSVSTITSGRSNVYGFNLSIYF